MNKLIEILVNMQSIDDEITEKLKLVNKIPLQLNDMKEELETAEKNMKDAKEELLKNKKKQKTYEMDIEQNETQIEKYSSQLNQITSNKEYKSLNKEIAGLKRKNKKIDDDLMSLMENESAQREKVEQTEADYKRIKKSYDEKSKKLEKEVEEENKEIEKLREKRNKLAKSTKKRNLVLKYANLIKTKNRKAVVSTTDNHACGGCGYNVIPQVQIELKNAKKLIFCESCSRFLVDDKIFADIEAKLNK